MASLSRVVNLLVKAGVNNAVIKWIMVAVGALILVWGGLGLVYGDAEWFQKMNPMIDEMSTDLDGLEE